MEIKDRVMPHQTAYQTDWHLHVGYGSSVTKKNSDFTLWRQQELNKSLKRNTLRAITVN